MPSSPFSPASPEATAIANLFTTTLVIAGLVLLLVTGMVTYALVRYRDRSGGKGGEPRQTSGNRTVELIWTGIPVLVLAVLFVFTVNTMHAVSAPGTANQQPDVIIIGHQWWWEYRYPKLGIETANELHIPVGQRLLARVETADVIHDFWVPNMGRKVDAIPGQQNYIYVQLDKPGLYLGTCAEYCGAQHAWMRIRVYAQDQAAFNTWVQDQKVIPAIPASGLAAEGASLFQQKTCMNCHAIQGTPANANIGPNLTHFAGRDTIGTGILTNTPANVEAWLRNPQQVKPGNNMPNLRLTTHEIQALTAYLETLK
jgi:cytochrome c oxidase subunit 2